MFLIKKTSLPDLEEAAEYIERTGNLTSLGSNATSATSCSCDLGTIMCYVYSQVKQD